MNKLTANTKKTQIMKQSNQFTNNQIFLDFTLSNEQGQFIFSPQESQSHQIFNQTKPKYHHKSNQIKRKTRVFTLNEDQKILNLVLLYGPKFKYIAKNIPGKSINIIKNRYYRDLRYRWDEVLGKEYAYLNEKKQEEFLENIVANSQIHQDLSNILIPMLNKLQMVIDQCLN